MTTGNVWPIALCAIGVLGLGGVAAHRWWHTHRWPASRQPDPCPECGRPAIVWYVGVSAQPYEHDCGACGVVTRPPAGVLR